MKAWSTGVLRSFIAAIAVILTLTIARADPLPSWNDGATKSAIIDFVTRVTTFGTARLRAGRAPHRHLRQ